MKHSGLGASVWALNCQALDDKGSSRLQERPQKEAPVWGRGSWGQNVLSWVLQLSVLRMSAEWLQETASRPTRLASKGIRLHMGLHPPASKGSRFGRTWVWILNECLCLTMCDLGSLTSWSLGSLLLKTGTMIPPHAERIKGGHVCKAVDTRPGAQNVRNKLYARMFQIALPGKVRCPIRMWLLPWKHRFLCSKGEWMLRTGLPSLASPRPVSVPPGVGTNLENPFPPLA